MGQTYIDLFIYGDVTLIVILLAVAILIMVPRQVLGAYFHWKVKRGGLFMQYPMEKRSVTLIETIYRENHDILHEALSKLRASLEKNCTEYNIICVVDASDLFPEENKELAEIAESYGAHVFMTNARSKRKNLRNAINWARENNMLHEFTAFHDSDSIPTTPDDNIIGELLRPFKDPEIGGVTTAQRLTMVDSPLQEILDWLEDSRIGSSMAAGSLFGQVGCLPGRLYMVRSHIVADWMDELVEEYWTVPVYSLKWPFVSWQKVQAHAGDDRRITLRVQQLGYKTVMNPYAKCETTLPRKFLQICTVFIRWATSSQWLTVINTRHKWFRRNWFIMYQYYGDLVITLIATFLPLRMLYLIAFGDRVMLIPIIEWLLISVFGLLSTFAFRQLWHLIRHPWRLLLLPRFIVYVTVWQYLRLYPWVNPRRISIWGSRKGADDNSDAERLIWFTPFRKWLTETQSAGIIGTDAQTNGGAP